MTTEIESSGSPRHVVFGLILPTIAIFGTIGNLILIAVFNTRKMALNPPSVYTTFLLLADLLYVIISVFLLSSEYSDPNNESIFPPKFTAYAFPLIQSVQAIISMILIMYSLDAFIYSMHAELSVIFTQKLSIKIAFAITGVTIIINFVNYFQFHVDNWTTPDNEVVKTICVSELYTKRSFQVYNRYIYPVVFFFIPWLLILIINLALLVVLKFYNVGTRMNVQFKDGRSLRLQAVLIICRLITEIPFFVYHCALWSTNEPIKEHIECHTKDLILNYSDNWPNLEMSYILSRNIFCNIKYYVYLISSDRFRYTNKRLFVNLCCCDIQPLKNLVNNILPEPKQVEDDNVDGVIINKIENKDGDVPVTSSVLPNANDRTAENTRKKNYSSYSSKQLFMKIKETSIPNHLTTIQEDSKNLRPESRQKSKLSTLIDDNFQPSIWFNNTHGKISLVKVKPDSIDMDVTSNKTNVSTIEINNLQKHVSYENAAFSVTQV